MVLGPDDEARPQLLRGYHILVADDSEDVRTYLLALFADAGASICEAADGREAIEVARRERPDLITLDLSMPGTDGVEAFCCLREDPVLSAVPVCIVTGHPEFRTVIYDRPVAPPDGYVDKPIDEQRLLSTVRRILALQDRKRSREEGVGGAGRSTT
jgi:twitching motility two-component system response regulator PilH